MGLDSDGKGEGSSSPVFAGDVEPGRIRSDDEPPVGAAGDDCAVWGCRIKRRIRRT